MMKLTSFFLLVSFIQVAAAVHAQNGKVTVQVKGTLIERVFEMIEQQSNYVFVYNHEQLGKLRPITADFKNEAIVEVLNVCLKGTGLYHEVVGNTIIIRMEQQKAKKMIVLIGKVTDRDSLPLPGVTVKLKETTLGVATDVQGKFKILVPENSKMILVFTAVGMKQVTKNALVGKMLHVIMQEDITALDAVDVISTGYQNVEKRHLTSSVTSIKAEDILMPGINSIDQLLEGHVPGMIFMQNSGQVGAAPKIKIRGTTTVLGNTAPLWVLDGVILTDPVNVDPQQINDLDFVNLLGNAISGLNPDDIDQIDVLKDASATAIYGPRASNGVIVITTKKGKIGKPAVSYSIAGTFRQRPRYTDRTVNVMNSEERIDYSREMVEGRMEIPNIGVDVGYEAVYANFYAGMISYDEFIRQVGILETVNTDWLGILMQDTYSHKHTLNVSGGTENMRYYSSIGYVEELGNIQGEKNKRYSAMTNLNLTYNKFTMAFSLSGNIQKKEYTPKDVGVTDYAFNTSRAVPAFSEDGERWFYTKQKDRKAIHDNSFNILHEIDQSYNKIESSQLSLNATLSYNILPTLKAQVTFSYGISNHGEETYYGEQSWYLAEFRQAYKKDGLNWKKGDIDNNSTCPVGGEIQLNDTRSENYSVRANLTYNSYLDSEEKHQITVSAIGELSSNLYDGFSITRRGYVKDRGMAFAEIDLAKYTKYQDWVGGLTARGILTNKLTNLVGLIGSASYVYKNDYILNSNIRVDASNKFGDQSNEKLLPIWSVSGRWNMHENIVKGAHWINTLALKTSFGYQGNMSATESPRLIIARKTKHPFYNEDYSEIKNFPNPDLGWEKTSTFNADLEFALFKNKLKGSMSYYYRHTTNAFMSKSVSSFNGVDQYTVNSGELTNQGVEWTFDFTPINTLTSKLDGLTSSEVNRKGFVWRLNPNFGTVLNKLIDKAKPKDKAIVDEDKISYVDYLNGKVFVSGRPVNSFYSYKFKGLNPQNGAPMFYDIEKERGMEFDQMDKDEIYRSVMTRSGAREPFLQGGISNYLSYGSFALNMNLSYSIGSKIRLFRMYPNGGGSMSPENNMRRELVNRWQRPGDELTTNVPGILTGEDYSAGLDLGKIYGVEFGEPYVIGESAWQMYDFSDIRVVSGDYLKIQSLSLRYVVPATFCKKLYLKTAYMSFSATNLYTFCSKKLKGQDPMQSGSTTLINMSIRPTYSVQLNVTF